MTEPLPSHPPAFDFRQRARLAVIGFAVGIGALLLGTVLVARLAGPTAAVEAPWLRGTLAILLLALPVVLLAPAAAFGAGLLLEGPRWLLAASIVTGVQLFPALAALLAPGEYPTPTARLLQVLLGAAAGLILCRLAVEAGQRRARARSAAGTAEPDQRLSAIDFSALKTSGAPETPPAPPASDGGGPPANQG